MGPVTTGSLIARSFEVFREGLVPFSTLALIFYSPIALISLAPALGLLDSNPFLESGFLFLAVNMLLTPIASAAVVYGVFQGLRGRSATIGQCVSMASSRAVAILILALLTAVLTGIGFMLCIIPGVVLTFGWFIAGPVLIVERLAAPEAMQRSWQLTDGYKLTLFLLAIAIGILQFLTFLLVGLPFGVNPLDGSALAAGVVYQLVDSLVTVVFTAFNAVAAGVAYHDIRSFREGLDEDELVAVFG